MRFLLAAAVALAFAAPAEAVSGGATADPAAYPFIASIGGFCTGTLVAPDRVLTAAHCLAGAQNQDASVRLGAASRDPLAAPAVPELAVKGLVLHPGFREAFPFAHKTPENATAIDDVGLIVLRKPVTGVAPVALSGGGEQPGLGVTVLGYGLTKPPAALNLKPGDVLQPEPIAPLQAGVLSLISQHDCLKAYPYAVPQADLCSEDLSADATPVGACAGDSGGPVLAPGPVQVGITSWGAEVKDNQCGAARLPDVAMKVSAFRAFIADRTPVFAPRSTVPARIAGTHRLTCRAPRFTGSHAKLRYRWGTAARGYDTALVSTLAGNPQNLVRPLMKPLRGATKRTLVAPRGRRVTCTATADNASGSWTVYARHSVRGS